MARNVALASSYAPPVSATGQAAASAASSIVTSGCSSRKRRSQRAATRGCRRGSFARDEHRQLERVGEAQLRKIPAAASAESTFPRAMARRLESVVQLRPDSNEKRLNILAQGGVRPLRAVAAFLSENSLARSLNRFEPGSVVRIDRRCRFVRHAANARARDYGSVRSAKSSAASPAAASFSTTTYCSDVRTTCSTSG
jgi:hypothetical protein